MSHAIAAAGRRKNRRMSGGTARDDRHCRILDRRARCGCVACRPRSIGLFRRPAVVYTKSSRLALLGIGDAEMQGMRPATEKYSLLIARRVRERHGATWGFGETGAAGPSGNRYGDPAGHTCMAIAGPLERAITLQTGSVDRRANMDMFTERALAFLVEAISAKS
jgi:nicotinamide mononucleotide (NMN) deamidase PncC